MRRALVLVAIAFTAECGWNAYGVIVVQAPVRGWLVAAGPEVVEPAFTAGRCAR